MYNHLCHYLADEPEIDVEAEKVHSGVGKEAHLTCIVHGEPRPSVSTSALWPISFMRPYQKRTVSVACLLADSGFFKNFFIKVA